MTRTQIQIPDPLYREVQRVAQQQDWSVSEVIRRGAEAVVRAYPPIKGSPASSLVWPAPIKSRLLITDPAALRDALGRDQEATRG
ncbi:antitoxin [Opitutaceae bacterium]